MMWKKEERAWSRRMSGVGMPSLFQTDDDAAQVMTETSPRQYLKQDATDWCQGRSWFLRAVLVVALAYMGVRHALSDDAADLFQFITLAIHEAGHVIFGVFGNETLTVAGGSITQLVGPLALAVSFLQQRDYFAIGVAGCWLSYSLYGMATYMADARAQQLQLVSLGGGDDIIHDWNYLFGHWGVLAYDTTIASVVRVLALIVLLTSLALSSWCCWRMGRPAR